jgi:CRISPR-associated protein Csb2
VDTVEDQVARELEERGLPHPLRIRRIDGPWGSFRIARRAKAGCTPSLGAHGVRVEFDRAVPGPLAIGRNSHFGMGLLRPV